MKSDPRGYDFAFLDGNQWSDSDDPDVGGAVPLAGSNGHGDRDDQGI